MEYDLEKIKQGARQRAIIWQTDSLYGNAIRDRIVDWNDLYHLGLFEEAATHIMEIKRDERILDEERNKLVGFIQGCSPGEAYERWEEMHEKVTEYHNVKVRGKK